MKITVRTIAAVYMIGVLTFSISDATAQVTIGVKTPSLGNIGKNKKKEKNKDQEEAPADKKSNTTAKEEPRQAPPKNVLDNYTEEQVAKIMDKASYPDYNADMKILEEAKKLYIFYQNGNTFYGTLSYDRAEALKQVQQYPKYRDSVAQIGQKYNEYWEVYRAKMNDKEAMEKLYLEDKKGVDKFQQTINYADPAADADKQLEAALAKAEELKARGSVKDTWNNDEYKLKVAPALEDARFFHAAYVAQKGNDEAAKALDQKIADYTAKCEKIKNDIRAAELAAVKCPVDAYKGADKEAMKKKVRDYWTKMYPQDKILGVYIIDQNWDRQKGSNWNSNYNRYENYDNSWLMVQVVVKDSEELASIYEASIQKNHMKNNEIDLSYFNKQLGIRKGEMLVKNVK